MQKVIVACIIFLNFLFPVFSSDFPERLSDRATISIVFVNYRDFSHSLFSKSCLRIYDKETCFDKIIDFAHFENFNDELFGVKFFFKPKKAKILVEPFFDYFLENFNKTNVSFSESILNLSPQKIKYIFNFISIMHKSLPNYEYEFDIITNNSEIHISKILHDCERMFDSASNEQDLFSEISKTDLNYKLINSSYVLFPKKTGFKFQKLDFPQKFKKEKFFLIIVLSVFASLVFLLTTYQVLAYFFEKLRIYSIFSVVQILDFLILFIAGLFGSIILFQDIFSNQTLFRNHFQFLFLFPLHFIASFTLFNPIKNETITIYYWSLTSLVSFLYILIFYFIENKLPIIRFLLVLSIFLRTAYYAFISMDIKKGRTLKLYALFIRFLDFISS